MVLSIIIPIYNTEGYLRRCFDSIVCNKTEEYEAILVNDGSTDNSRKICEDFVRQYPRRFRLFNKQNGGLSSARNYGIRQKLKGNYILFLDPDDYLETGFLDRICEKLAHKGKAEVYEFGYVVHERDRKNRVYQPPVCADESTPMKGEEYLKIAYTEKGSYPWCTWKYIIDREFFEKTGLLFEEGRNYEDALLVPRLLLKCKRICTIPRVEYHYTAGRAGSITQTFSVQNELDRLYASYRGIRLFDRVKDKKLKALAQDGFSKTFYSVLPSLILEKDREKKRILRREIIKKKGMMKYSLSWKPLILKWIVGRFGIYVCGWLVYVRRRWKRAGAAVFMRRGIWGCR